MFEKFLSGEQENFRQRYEGTYGYFKHGTKRTLCILTGISSRQVDFQDKDGIKYNLNVDAEGDIGFEFIPPESGWYNTLQYGPLFVKRIPARQFQRGLSSRNTTVSRLDGTLRKMPVDFSTLVPIYQDELPIDKAFKHMVKKGTGIALNSMFAIDLKGFLYCYDSLIASGKFTDDFVWKGTIPDLFKVELLDAFKRANIKVENV